MMQRTRAITERYLKEKDTIAVVVVPANITRVRDSQVGRVAKPQTMRRHFTFLPTLVPMLVHEIH